MGAVVSFVEDVFDSVGDVFEAVGDVVEDVVDFVGDVVEKVGDVVQAVIDDPIPTLLAIGGSFVGIPPYVTMGVITAARGGDLEDIALSMGTAYIGAEIAPSFSSSISSTVSSSFIEAGFNETFSEVASNSISKGLVNGTIAEIKGGSFEDGFAGGFTGGLVAGGVGEVGSYVKDDVIALAQESGLDLKDATSLYNAGTRAVSAGVTSEITGKGDFVTSFTNSAVGSGIDSGTRSLNSSIDEQFKTAATDWNEKDKNGEPVDTNVVGAGIPDDVVGQVTVSSIGVDATADTNTVDAKDANAVDTSTVLSDTSTDRNSDKTATSNISVLAQAPKADTVDTFDDLVTTPTTSTNDTVVVDNTDVTKVPTSVSDIAQNLGTDTQTPTTVGALTTVADANKPVDVLSAVTPTSTTAGSPITEAPIAGNLLTEGLNPEQPVGGLNAVATKTADEKMADSLGLKLTDITKPVVATVGSLLKNSLTQQKRPTPRAPTARPAGALQMANARPTARPSAPTKMDVAKLIPIQKAAPVAPPKTLASTAKLSPVTNIAGLTSMLKKTG
jgi:hypothetical protein